MVKIVEAGKEHNCSTCNKKLEKGDRCFKKSISDWGRRHTYYYCLSCGYERGYKKIKKMNGELVTK